MTPYLQHIALSIASLVIAAGCAGPLDSEADGPTGTTEDRLTCENAINPNAINPNSVGASGLTGVLDLRSLSGNALSPLSLATSALSAILDPGSNGNVSRQLLRYTVSCALGPSQSFTFTWFDGLNLPHVETYSGLLRLATDWETQALDQTGQEWISACLGSRTNWYGVTVSISSRGNAGRLTEVTSTELSDYTNLEGAFWGNLFASTPYLYACHYSPDIAHSRSQERDCAAGHLNTDQTVSDCGLIQIVGSCDDYCQPFSGSNLYYPSCASDLAGVSASSHVITTFLQ